MKLLLILFFAGIAMSQEVILRPSETPVTLMSPDGASLARYLGVVEYAPFGTKCIIYFDFIAEWVGLIGRDSLVVRLKEIPSQTVYADPSRLMCMPGNLVLISKQSWDEAVAAPKKKRAEEARQEQLKNKVRALLKGTK